MRRVLFASTLIAALGSSAAAFGQAHASDLACIRTSKGQIACGQVLRSSYRTLSKRHSKRQRALQEKIDGDGSHRTPHHSLARRYGDDVVPGIADLLEEFNPPIRSPCQDNVRFARPFPMLSRAPIPATSFTGRRRANSPVVKWCRENRDSMHPITSRPAKLARAETHPGPRFGTEPRRTSITALPLHLPRRRNRTEQSILISAPMRRIRASPMIRPTPDAMVAASVRNENELAQRGRYECHPKHLGTEHCRGIQTRQLRNGWNQFPTSDNCPASRNGRVS
jgi:hypothetical protein